MQAAQMGAVRDGRSVLAAPTAETPARPDLRRQAARWRAMHPNGHIEAQWAMSCTRRSQYRPADASRQGTMRS